MINDISVSFHLLTSITLSTEKHWTQATYRLQPYRIVILQCRMHRMDGLVQDCSIFSVLAMKILQSCTKPSNKLRWNYNQNSFFFIQENASKNIVWDMSAILSKRRWVKLCHHCLLLAGCYRHYEIHRLQWILGNLQCITPFIKDHWLCMGTVK